MYTQLPSGQVYMRANGATSCFLSTNACIPEEIGNPTSVKGGLFGEQEVDQRKEGRREEQTNWAE